MINADQFPRIIRDIERKYKSVYTRLPLLVGNEAVNFTLDNFKLQGFIGTTFQKWIPTKKSWGKKKKRGGTILVGRGHLRRSIRITRLSRDAVAIGSNVRYARAHNEGLRLGVIQSVSSYSRRNGSQVRAHERKINMRIPKRQFMGDSPYLRARLKRIAVAEFMRHIRFLKK